MKKTKKHLGSWIGSGACFALALALLGITVPKQGQVERCEQEIARLTPIVEDIRRQTDAQDKAKNYSRLDAELGAMLPAEDEFLEFHLMVKKCQLDAGIVELGYYAMEAPDYWPPKSGSEDKRSESEDRIPEKYNETGGEKSDLRRFVLELDFKTDYASLTRFVNHLQQLPRFNQIISMSMDRSGAQVHAVLRVEAYSLKGVR